jgi:hypothetical protein
MGAPGRGIGEFQGRKKQFSFGHRRTLGRMTATVLQPSDDAAGKTEPVADLP